MKLEKKLNLIEFNSIKVTKSLVKPIVKLTFFVGVFEKIL